MPQNIRLCPPRGWTALALACAIALLVAVPSLVRAEDDATSAEQAELDVMIQELRVEAQSIRGLEWKHDVPGQIIAPKDIPAAFQEELDALLSKRDQEMATRVARRLGMLRADQDIWELQKQMMAGMAGGFYSPRAKKLFVVEGFRGDAARPVILHELVHALEDQHQDFNAISLPLMADMDRTFANGCVVEGSAEYARVAYQSRHKDIAALFAQASADPKTARRQKKVMQSVPAWMILPMMMQYQTGPAFVAKALKAAKADGESENPYAKAMATVWADAPISQEQVIHSERWYGDTRDYPRGVVFGADLGEAIGRGWEIVHDQRMGELDLALYIDYFLGGKNGLLNPTNMFHSVPATEVARKAAAGWDGGRMVFIEKPGKPMALVQAWCFDTAKDAEEAGQTLSEVLRKFHGDDWAPQTWQAVTPRLGAPFDSRRLTYKGRFGRGRLMVRDKQVLIADGIPEKSFERLWRWVEKTRCMKDDRDTWVPAVVPTEK